MKFVAKTEGPYLVVVPLPVLRNWKVEFKRFLPQMWVMKLHSADMYERASLKSELSHELLSKWGVVVTTYDMAKNPEMRNVLVSSIHWRVVLLDKGHVVRNENAIISTVVPKLYFEHAMLLTGTPMQNNLHELWSLLNFLHPDLFHSPERFNECLNISGTKKSAWTAPCC